MFDNPEGSAAMMTITKIDSVIDPDKEPSNVDINDVAVLPTRNLILFPEVTLPIGISRASTRAIAEEAVAKNMLIGIICQKDTNEENPTRKDLEKYGVFARILNVLTLPNGVNTAIIQAFKKFRIIGDGEGKSMEAPHISVRVKPVNDIIPPSSDKEFLATVKSIKEITLQIIEKNGDSRGIELGMNLRNISDPVSIINMVSTMFPLEQEIKMRLLVAHRLKERASILLTELGKQEQLISLAENIKNKALHGMQEHQKTAFLQEQLTAIKEELYGEENDDIKTLLERLDAKPIPEQTKEIVKKEIDKLERINSQSPDYSIQYNYLDFLLSLPWGNYKEELPSLKDAETILEDAHYGLNKVKERIVEQLAVIINNPGVKSPIICLVGPPGVGKTSIARSVATALGRDYQRISLGGVHDEAEIRGHRRTYIGAMPGRIIDALKRVETGNPVLVLDEIDKLGNDYKGDPSAALLEVLDPEQNSHFHDNYLDLDYDLSKVLFIATANTLSTLPQPLLDRMEIIDISGYAVEEKLEIAKRHIIEKVKEELGLKNCEIDFNDDALNVLIEEYTLESGVRQMEKKIAAIFRKLLTQKLKGEQIEKNISGDKVRDLLGVSHLGKEKYIKNETPGVATGLAWTAAGGDVLYIESSLVPGKGDKLSVTGNLGDVMKESATLALQYVKANAEKFGIDAEVFEKYNIHIHVPEGAVPKDGPSAGITLVTALVSALKDIKVKDGIAMTGEITLRGKVLPVGGIKEKVLAAKRSGLDTIIICEDNRKDVAEIAAEYLRGLSFIYVKNINEVLEHALSLKINNYIK